MKVIEKVEGTRRQESKKEYVKHVFTATRGCVHCDSPITYISSQSSKSKLNNVIILFHTVKNNSQISGSLPAEPLGTFGLVQTQTCTIHTNIYLWSPCQENKFSIYTLLASMLANQINYCGNNMMSSWLCGRRSEVYDNRCECTCVFACLLAGSQYTLERV